MFLIFGQKLIILKIIYLIRVKIGHFSISIKIQD